MFWITNRQQLFDVINIGLLICYAAFIFFDLFFLGTAICFTLLGVLSMFAVYFNAEPLWLGMGGFDYTMRLLFKEYYNRYFNLTLAVIELLFGIGSIIKLAE